MRVALFPQEIEVWYVLPAIRRELSIELVKQGLNQKKIAKLLNITEPTVSNYIRSKRGGLIEFDEKVNEMIKQAAVKLLKNGSKEKVISEVNKISKYIRTSKLLCQIHKKYAGIDDSCNTCY